SSIVAQARAAAWAVAKKEAAGAEHLLKEATTIELSLDAPSGPPEPIKPSFELYGELLLDQGRLKDAAAQFDVALMRMPNRRALMQGIEKTRAVRPSDAR